MSTRTCSSAILAAAAVLIAVPAQAQSATDSRQFSVSGNVPSMCVAGTVTGGNATFDLGVLVDTSTGLLRNNLAVPSKTAPSYTLSTCEPTSAALKVPVKVGVLSSVLDPEAMALENVEPLTTTSSRAPVMETVCDTPNVEMVMLLLEDTTRPRLPVVSPVGCTMALKL